MPLYYWLHNGYSGDALATQGLGLCALNAQGPGLIPSLGTKVPQAVQCGKMLHITHYQRNANQNHYEVPFHASQNGCDPKVYKQ